MIDLKLRHRIKGVKMMQQLYDLFLKTGLRPFDYFTDTAQLEKEFTRSDLATILTLLFRGQQPMSALATELGAPLSSMTSIAKRLERKGMIKRMTSPQDQRIILVSLSEEGQWKAEQAKHTMEQMLDRVQQALTAEELEQFIQLMLKIARAFKSKDATERQERKSDIVKRITIDE
jgi:DNA-binding MarR family transcriptional regulator